MTKGSSVCGWSRGGSRTRGGEPGRGLVSTLSLALSAWHSQLGTLSLALSAWHSGPTVRAADHSGPSDAENEKNPAMAAVVGTPQGFQKQRLRSESNRRWRSVIPDARYSSTSETVIRSPRIEGFPLRFPGSTVMRLARLASINSAYGAGANAAKPVCSPPPSTGTTSRQDVTFPKFGGWHLFPSSGRSDRPLCLELHASRSLRDCGRVGSGDVYQNIKNWDVDWLREESDTGFPKSC